MPRIARVNFNTNFFHVIVQGINREYIFDKTKYMEKYKYLLITNLTKYKVKIISYCIMNNHAHILLHTESVEMMSKYMKSVNTSYAQYYNKEEDRVGIVFRNRYESEPIYDLKYLFNCMAYIHNNPVKANIVDSVEMYKYSSYKDYINLKGIVTKEDIKFLFGSTSGYLEIYKNMHKTNMEFKDYSRNIDYKEKYKHMMKTDIKEIVSNKQMLEETVVKLVLEHKMPINKTSELLGISRFKTSRIIHKKVME